MISKELLEILACPACHGGINPLEEQQILLCKNCHRAYPIRDGIPVMLIEEAEIWTEEQLKVIAE
jgi:hypothetical protein